MNDTAQDLISGYVYTILGRNATACRIRTAAVDDINTIFLRLANQCDLRDNKNLAPNRFGREMSTGYLRSSSIDRQGPLGLLLRDCAKILSRKVILTGQL